MLPTQRLSPKNQVTIPREARALLVAGEVDHVRGMRHGIPKNGGGEVFPVLLLLTEKELQRREERIIAGFEEIQRFVEKHGRAPQHGEDRDIIERL